MRLNIKVKREQIFLVNLARVKTLTCCASLAEQGSTVGIITTHLVWQESARTPNSELG